jgi:hypothetical protein
MEEDKRKKLKSISKLWCCIFSWCNLSYLVNSWEKMPHYWAFVPCFGIYFFIVLWTSKRGKGGLVLEVMDQFKEVMMKSKDFMNGHGGNIHFVVRFREF